MTPGGDKVICPPPNTSNQNSNELNNDENNKDKVKNKGNDDSMIVMI